MADPNKSAWDNAVEDGNAGYIEDYSNIKALLQGINDTDNPTVQALTDKFSSNIKSEVLNVFDKEPYRNGLQDILTPERINAIQDAVNSENTEAIKGLTECADDPTAISQYVDTHLAQKPEPQTPEINTQEVSAKNQESQPNEEWHAPLKLPEDVPNNPYESMLGDLGLETGPETGTEQTVEQKQEAPVTKTETVSTTTQHNNINHAADVKTQTNIADGPETSLTAAQQAAVTASVGALAATMEANPGLKESMNTLFGGDNPDAVMNPDTIKDLAEADPQVFNKLDDLAQKPGFDKFMDQLAGNEEVQKMVGDMQGSEQGMENVTSLIDGLHDAANDPQNPLDFNDLSDKLERHPQAAGMIIGNMNEGMGFDQAMEKTQNDIMANMSWAEKLQEIGLDDMFQNLSPGLQSALSGIVGFFANLMGGMENMVGGGLMGMLGLEGLADGLNSLKGSIDNPHASQDEQLVVAGNGNGKLIQSVIPRDDPNQEFNILTPKGVSVTAEADNKPDTQTLAGTGPDNNQNQVGIEQKGPTPGGMGGGMG